MGSPSAVTSGGEQRYRGIPVSRGIATGPIQFTDRRFVRPRTWPLSEGQAEGEWQRLNWAISRTREQITSFQQQIIDRGAELSEARIFDAHLMVLDDPAVLEELKERLNEDLLNAEAIYYKVIERYIETLRKVDDPYLRERAIDIEDVACRVMANLLDRDDPETAPETPHVHFAHDLTPSDTVNLKPGSLLGFATELGSYTSHTAIMARSLNIPGVVGLAIPKGELRNGQEVILDGYNGVLIVSPSSETRAEYAEIATHQDELNAQLEELRDVPATTSDGIPVILSANIEFGHEVDFVKQNGAAGIGLYRTEFFFFQEPKIPDEERQFETYKAIAESVDPDGVIIRTLDVGADKFPEGRHAEPNPFLGWRGIRVSLEKRDVFKTQLRACLRASAFAKVRIMYPMISGLEELRAANALLEECRQELKAEDKAYDLTMEVGCMIELPSAAMMAPQLAGEVDFFSVGTNDLIQYTIAVDRINERVAHLYQPGHPAILRLLKIIVDAAHAQGIWVGVCGEMAGDTLFTPVLVGLGVDEFSVGASQLLRIKHALQHLDSVECKTFVAELLTLSSVDEIVQRCRNTAKAHYGELFQ